MDGTPVTVAATYPQSTLNSTPSCSSLTGTASYETYETGWRNLVVYKWRLHTRSEIVAHCGCATVALHWLVEDAFSNK